MPVAAAYKPPQLKKKIVIMSLDNEKKLSFKISLEFHTDAMDPFNFFKNVWKTKRVTFHSSSSFTEFRINVMPALIL